MFTSGFLLEFFQNGFYPKIVVSPPVLEAKRARAEG